MKFVPNEIAKLNSGLTKVVPVLASFDTSGNIRPLYVRIGNDSYKVLECSMQSYGPLSSYRCLVNNAGMQRAVLLTYHPNESCWTTQI